MELLLVRHAIAEEPAPQQPDPERALTEEGIARFLEAVDGLQRLGLSGDRCWHSPWRRAVETAGLLRALVESDPLTEPLLALEPGDALMARLAGEAPEARLLLVGHQPWLGELAGWLCRGERGADPGLRIRKGSLLWLRGEPRPAGMEIEALLKPSLLRRAARL